MSIEQNKRAVHQFFDALNRHDPVLLAAVTLPDVALMWPETISWLYTTTKGLHFEIVDLVAEGAEAVTDVENHLKQIGGAITPAAQAA